MYNTTFIIWFRKMAYLHLDYFTCRYRRRITKIFDDITLITTIYNTDPDIINDNNKLVLILKILLGNPSN